MRHELRIHSSFSSALGGEAHILEVRPKEVTDLPVYFHGGHGVSPEKYLRYMAGAHGLHAFTIVYPAKRLRDTTYWAIEGAHKYRLNGSQVRSATACFNGPIISQGQLAMAEDLGLAVDRQGGTVRAIGQSLGALSLTKAVADAPHSFAAVVLPYPAGMIRPDMRRVFRSGVRYARAWQGRQPVPAPESIRAYVNRWGITSLPSFPANVAANGDNILRSYHAPLLDTIRGQANPPHVAIIAGEDDHIFSPERMREHVHERSIDDFVTVPGRHAIGDRRVVMDMVLDLARAEA